MLHLGKTEKHGGCLVCSQVHARIWLADGRVCVLSLLLLSSLDLCHCVPHMLWTAVMCVCTGDLSTCTSTRAVATHLDGDGKAQYLLNSPDPTGVAVGSKFEDPLRRVTVILEEWTGSQVTIRVIA